MPVAHPKAELPNPWPFDQVPDCAVLTTKHVFCGFPITHVFHDADDHGWQFHYPGEKSTADAMVVALKEIYYHDPSVAEVADLLPGWMAVRDDIGTPWKREQNL